MKIKLELEDYRLATTRENIGGETRWLMVKIGEKPLAVWVKLDTYHWPDPKMEEFYERQLVERMEFMLEKILKDACAAIPEGTEIPLREGQ